MPKTVTENIKILTGQVWKPLLNFCDDDDENTFSYNIKATLFNCATF